MYWSRNRFEVYAWPRGSKPTGIVNQGSYPNEPVKQGSDMVRPLPIPPGWAERSYDFLYEGDGPDANTWIGDWQKQGVLEGPAMVDSAGKIVNPGQRVFEVTGPLPPWFCVVGPPAAGESAAPPDGRGASAAETRRPPPKPSSSRCAW
jgi:hypothetical protein